MITFFFDLRQWKQVWLKPSSTRWVKRLAEQTLLMKSRRCGSWIRNRLSCFAPGVGLCPARTTSPSQVYPTWNHEGGGVQRGDRHHQPVNRHDPIAQEQGFSWSEKLSTCWLHCVGAALAKQPLASSRLVWMRSLAGSSCWKLDSIELHRSVDLMIAVGKQSLTCVGLEAKRCYRFGMMTSSRNAGLTLEAFVVRPYTRWMARLFAEIDFTPQSPRFLEIWCKRTCALNVSIDRCRKIAEGWDPAP